MYIFLMILMLLMPIAIYIGFRSLFANKHSRLTIKEALKKIIKENGLSIDQVNIFGDRLIAMDRKMYKLILIGYKNGIAWENCLNLHEIVFCRIANKASKVNGYIQKVNLELTLRESGIITISFFDEEIDSLRDLPLRVKKAQYWKRKIQYQISTVQLSNNDQGTI